MLSPPSIRCVGQKIMRRCNTDEVKPSRDRLMIQISCHTTNVMNPWLLNLWRKLRTESSDRFPGMPKATRNTEIKEETQWTAYKDVIKCSFECSMSLSVVHHNPSQSIRHTRLRFACAFVLGGLVTRPSPFPPPPTAFVRVLWRLQFL